MKNKSLKQLVKKLMGDGHIKAKTTEGGRQTLYYHLSRGRVDLDYVQTDQGKVYLWTDRQYPIIVKQLTKWMKK